MFVLGNICLGQTYTDIKYNQYATFGMQMHDTKVKIGIGCAQLLGMGDTKAVVEKDIDVPLFFDLRYSTRRIEFITMTGFETNTYKLYFRGQIDYQINNCILSYISITRMKYPYILIGIRLRI